MKNKVLLVIGGSSDVGISLIKKVANNYDYIIAHYANNDTELKNLQSTLKNKLILIKGDFSSLEETNKFISDIKEKDLIPTHIVDLAAPRCKNEKFAKMSWEVFEKDIFVSLRSLVIVLNEFLPIMAKNGGGKVLVMLTSYTKNIPPKYLSSYVTSKYALLGLVKSLSQEYAGKNITINGISPSMIETKFLENIPKLIVEENALKSPTGKNLVVEDVIPLFEFLLSDKANAITGENIGITNGN